MDAASTGSCPRSRRCCSRPRREADELAALHSITSWALAGELLPRSGSPASLPEGPDLVQGEAASFLRVHCLEDPLVSRLKLLQRDGPVTVSVHQDEKHPHIRATQSHTSSARVGAHRSSTLLPRSRSPASLPESPDLVQGDAAIFLRVHCLEDPLVTRLKLLHRDGPVTVSVHQDEKHAHIRATQAHTSSAHVGAHRSSTLLLLLRHLWLLLPLLGTRSDSATRQNKSRRREHQNVLLHFISPQKHAPPTNLARAILMRATVA